MEKDLKNLQLFCKSRDTKYLDLLGKKTQNMLINKSFNYLDNVEAKGVAKIVLSHFYPVNRKPRTSDIYVVYMSKHQPASGVTKAGKFLLMRGQYKETPAGIVMPPNIYNPLYYERITRKKLSDLPILDFSTL